MDRFLRGHEGGDSGRSPKGPVVAPSVRLAERRHVRPAVPERLSVNRRDSDARARCLGLPGTLMGKLVQELGELLTGNDPLRAVLRELLQRGANLLADGGVHCHVMGKLMKRRGDLLLLCGDLLRLAGLLSKTLLSKTLLAHQARWIALSERTLAELAESGIAEAGVAEARGAELGSNALHAAVAAHSGRPEHGGCQRLSEIRTVVSVRHDVLHWLSSE
jgi:hypothetical protein